MRQKHRATAPSKEDTIIVVRPESTLATPAEAIAARELHRQIIADGHCGPIQRFAVSPRLPTEAITPETLRPEHLDELTSLAEGCLEAIWHACLYAENARRTEEDRWDLQSVLVTAMNTGLRAGLFLWAGLENEILGAYATAPGEISGGGMTQSNAHQLAAQLALDVVCQAWNEVYLRSTWLVKSEEGERAVPCKRQNVGMIYRYRRPLVNMLADQGGGFPLFKREHVPAVADAILHYCGAKLRRVPPGKPRVLPWTGDVADLRHWGLNATAILARIRWENAKVKEQRSRITPPKDQTAENPDIPDPDETLVLKTRGNSRAILLYLWKRGPVSREQLRQAIWKEKKISDRGIDKAVEDLNLRLSLIIETGCKTKVIRNGGVYFLQHPQK